MEKNTSSDDNIKKGVIQYINILKICNKDKFESILEKVQQSFLTISDQEVDINTNQLQFWVKEEYMNSLVPNSDKENSEHEKIFNSNKLLNNDIKMTIHEPEISIRSSSNDDYIHTRIAVDVENNYTREVYNSINNFINDINLKNVNGDNLIYEGREFLLQPSIGKSNDEEHFINFKLSIWNSGYASIIQEHEIRNIDTSKLSESGLELVYDSYKLPLALHNENKDLFGLYDFNGEIGNTDLNKLYVQAICNIVDENIDISDTGTALLLIDYSFKPKDIGNRNKIYQNSMCNLITSPIFRHNELSTEQKNELIKNNRYILNNYSEIYASTNPKIIISSIGKDMSHLPNEDVIGMYDRVLLQGVVPAMEIVMLDKFIYKRIYNLLNNNIDRLTLEDLEYIEEEIYKYKIMLNELKTYKFDTLTKLVKFIENTQTAGITKPYIISSIDNFNQIIKSKRQRRRDESSRIVSIFVGVLTLLLSYTSIYDIISIINESYILNFTQKNITNYSLYAEIILAIIFMLLYKRSIKVTDRSKKNL